jgi:hypothetical protein
MTLSPGRMVSGAALSGLSTMPNVGGWCDCVATR